MKPPRIAVRAVIVEQARLLMVNAWAGGISDLLCAPGGGVETHQSLPDNLIREVHEETGLTIEVGDVCLVNEFHDGPRDFHQIEIFFRARITAGRTDPEWMDPEGVVTTRKWLTRSELERAHVKPAALVQVAFDGGVHYDPLETIVH